jgi:hypothetical protein
MVILTHLPIALLMYAWLYTDGWFVVVKERLRLATEIRDNIEIVHTPEYTTFLTEIVPEFLAILDKTPITFGDGMATTVSMPLTCICDLALSLSLSLSTEHNAIV